MSTIQQRYAEMHRLCSHYHDMANKLRDQAYGYETSLDIVLPYNAKFTLEPVGKHLWGIQGFADKLCEYDTSLPSEANPTYPQALTAEDYTFMQSMTICIVYYLHSECKKTDYTFLGCIKLLKTFLGEIIDLEEAKNRETSTFWIMYNTNCIQNGNTPPVSVQEAFSRLFQNFDYNYMSMIADRLYTAVRFFLYDQKLDYISDRWMSIAMYDMMKEIKERLHTIHKNRLPRTGWRSDRHDL